MTGVQTLLHSQLKFRSNISYTSVIQHSVIEINSIPNLIHLLIAPLWLYLRLL
jgi:hypothetical protein